MVIDRKLAEELLNIMDGCRGYMPEIAENAIKDRARSIAMLKVVQDTIENIRSFATRNFTDNPEINLANACVCVIASIQDVLGLLDKGSSESVWKIKRELGPFLDTAYLQFYYSAIVINHPEEKEAFLEKVSKAPMLNRPEESDIDLSIIITGYNHLDATMDAVRSVLMFMPKGIKTELILHNHGSSDGTREFFESIEGAHVLNVAINAALPYEHLGAACGKYYMQVSNDVIIGTNALENMYKAISEDASIGWIVPATSNISNKQAMPLEYTNVEELLEQTRINNVYDTRRHEQRTRLCNPVDVALLDRILQLYKEQYIEMCCDGTGFPDDKTSLWMRRHGYKNILQKDAYCHHIGSLTIGKSTSEEAKATYLRGRQTMFKDHGIDPWGKGAYFDDYYLEKNTPEYHGEDKLVIVGVNGGLGSNALKVKQNLIEQGADNITLINITNDESYMPDLLGLSDQAYYFQSISAFVNEKSVKKIDYLVVDEYSRNIDEIKEELQLSNVEINHILYRISNDEWIEG